MCKMQFEMQEEASVGSELEAQGCAVVKDVFGFEELFGMNLVEDLHKEQC